MQNDAGSKKKTPRSLNTRTMNQGQKNAKRRGSQKTKKNPSESKPECLNLKAIKCKRTKEIRTQKKNPSETKPEGLKPKAIKCKKTLEVKK